MEKLWVEKYRPLTFDEYVFTDDSQKLFFKKLLDAQEIPHLLLSGVQGTGKTTMAKILINGLDLDASDVLTINASDENSVDVIREKIKTFVTTASFGTYKVVHLSEADYLSINSQAILRTLMEEQYTEMCRFVLTCNYTHKIIPALKSRLQHVEFKAHQSNSIAIRLAEILAAEKVTFTIDSLDQYVSTFSPDIRKVINEAQAHTHNGTLTDLNVEYVNDYTASLLETVDAKDWQKGQKIIRDNVTDSDWEALYTTMYEQIETLSSFQSNPSRLEEALVAIAEHLYKHSIVANPEINFTALLITLAHID